MARGKQPYWPATTADPAPAKRRTRREKRRDAIHAQLEAALAARADEILAEWHAGSHVPAR
jgi:hypothetical protein